MSDLPAAPATISPAEFGDLVNRPPLLLETPDIKKIVAVLRDARSKFDLGQKQAGAPKQLTGEKAKIAKLDLDIKL